MGRMSWGAGLDHGTAMPPQAPAAPGGAEEEEKRSAGKAAEELLEAIKLAGEWVGGNGELVKS